jgi:hypothetical protein
MLTLSKPESDADNLAYKAWLLAFPAILISLFVTLIRFSLEYVGIPEIYIFMIGLLWLTLGFAVYWGTKIARHDKAFVLLFLILTIFAPLSRIPVFLAWWLDTTYELGTHYNIFDNWTQALIGQLFYGSLVQIIPGLFIGAITIIVYRKFWLN